MIFKYFLFRFLFLFGLQDFKKNITFNMTIKSLVQVDIMDLNLNFFYLYLF